MYTTVIVSVTVNPISDIPGLTVDAPLIVTPEDQPVSLGLNAPAISDDGTPVPPNNARTERIGPVTLTGIPSGAQLLDAAGVLLFTSTGVPITILISDLPTLTGATGTLTMTKAEYEALKVLPPPGQWYQFYGNSVSYRV